VADPLLGLDAVVAEWDPVADLYILRAWVAGPAGTAGLSLADGVEVDIDVAWPSRLAELRVRSSTASDAVERLLGADRAQQLSRLQPGAPRPLDLDDRERAPDPDAMSALMLGTLAHQLGHDLSASIAGQAAALLEASVWLAGLDTELGATPTATADFQRGASMLLQPLSTYALRRITEDDVRVELADLVRRAITIYDDDPGLNDRLIALANDLSSRRDDERTVGRRMAHLRAGAPEAAAAPVPMAARAQPASAAEVVESTLGVPMPVDRRALPSTLRTADVRAQQVTAAEIEVRVADADVPAEGCWTRAFDHVGTLVAMAPLHVVGRDAGALLLVAPDIMNGVEIDVTDLPGVRRPSRALGSVGAAIVQGRRAASAERSGRVADAAVAWRRSADLWHEAGDATRSSTAETYAAATFARGQSGRGADRIPQALVADRIDR
jgi:hypothetical protein